MFLVYLVCLGFFLYSFFIFYFLGGVSFSFGFRFQFRSFFVVCRKNMHLFIGLLLMFPYCIVEEFIFLSPFCCERFFLVFFFFLLGD